MRLILGSSPVKSFNILNRVQLSYFLKEFGINSRKEIDHKWLEYYVDDCNARGFSWTTSAKDLIPVWQSAQNTSPRQVATEIIKAQTFILRCPFASYLIHISEASPWGPRALHVLIF